MVGWEFRLWLTLIVVYYVAHGREDSDYGKRPRRKAKMQLKKGLKILAELGDKNLFWSDDLKPMLIPRISGSDNNKKVQKHIKDRLSPLGFTIEEDHFEDDTPYGRKPFTNIIATFNVSAPRRLTLACHFDSKDMTHEKKPFEFIGATDSAVPCAILLENARLLQCLLNKREKDLDFTLQLVFLDGEEAFKHWSPTDSIYGARHLASKWKEQRHPQNSSLSMLHAVNDFVLLDLIGTKDTRFANIFPETSKLYQDLHKIEKDLFKENLLLRKADSYEKYVRERKVLFPNMPTARHAGVQDDHLPFMYEGVPILHLISLPFPSVWHEITDNGDSLDANTIEDFSRIFRTFVAGYLQISGNHSGCKNVAICFTQLVLAYVLVQFVVNGW
ncbi:glutaminyl-peptide cyclotransferase-like isoform X2 [Gigantopelta aegis]|uniref:glutaminyl-peptide cyclotransferase-like isoform X2 n=1 Tax=Gigantopelta aegis TaxID=1735272 RepID=UPI001B88B8EB|nr:glutaminyl-peptide cyclotransferase-like isoform X2 [Gigantopelta aegis]